MKDRDKTKEQLLKEVQELRKEKNELIASFEKDIIERKKDEEASKKSEGKYRTLFDTLLYGAVYQDENGEIISANPAAENILGISLDQMKGRTSMDSRWKSIHQDGSDFPGETHPAIVALRTGKPVTNIIMGVFHPKKEEYRWININAVPQLKQGEKKPFQVYTTFEDISESKKVEEMLKESEERYRSLFEHMIDGYAFCKMLFKDGQPDDFIYIKTNTAFEELTKLKNVDGKRVSEVIPGIQKSDAELIKLYGRVALSGKSEKFEFFVEGLQDWYSVSVYSPATEYFVAVFEVITERKLVEEEIKRKNEELQLLNAEKDKFFSVIAHDLRSPFNNLLGFTQLMAEELPTMTLKEIQKIAGSMRESAINLYDLLENLLEWSRLQRGVTTYSPSSVSLMSKISEDLDSTSELAAKKEIDISYDVPEDLIVYADENMLASILRNLSSNAVKFTPKGGNVILNAKPIPNNFVEISVKDTGIGMNKEMVENLFQLGINTSRKGTDKEPSTGLGLIICKEFIEKQGGKIWVESQKGKGSTFYFTLPVNPPVSP